VKGEKMQAAIDQGRHDHNASDEQEEDAESGLHQSCPNGVTQVHIPHLFQLYTHIPYLMQQACPLNQRHFRC
jgi:hypothetical protein